MQPETSMVRAETNSLCVIEGASDCASRVTSENMVATVDNDTRSADFVGEPAVKKPVRQLPHVGNDVRADATIQFACVVANTNNETRCASAEFSQCVRMCDAETFNQFCIEYGWLELLVDSGNDRVPSPCAVKLFHRRFGGANRRDPIEELRYLLKYIVIGGFDGVPAPAGWLLKVEEYIARMKSSRTAQSGNS
ncbi:hypothetical protein BLA18628_01018 [Burkholderia aenigmatica]|nr:hypothetical protein BLA18628_01018 [Burkholderia aenigmatica]